MDGWERFDETSLTDKKTFYSILNINNIKDVDYRNAQKNVEELKIKNLGDYYYLYVQSDTLLLSSVFENFRIEFIQIYEIDPA